MSGEAWKGTGNCKECRRINYCKKECSAHKKRMNKIVGSAVYAVMKTKGIRTPAVMDAAVHSQESN